MQEFEKIAHGSTRLCQQISFWWCVLRQVRSKEVQYSSGFFTAQQPIVDNFFDHHGLKNYRQEFDLVFNQMFGEFPNPSFKYYSRYQHGLIIYHSMLYNRRQNADSYSICVFDTSDPVKSILYYGQVLFFFNFKGESFCFLRRYLNSKNLFSSLMKPIDEVPNWNMYIDKWYQIIKHSTSELVIYPCSSIIAKCIFLPIDNEFTICTKIEFEMEHD